jgi:cell division protein FtsX
MLYILYSLALYKDYKTGYETVRQNINRLSLIDSTTISLSLSQHKWAKFRRTKSGVELHLSLRFTDNPLPAGAIITTANKADRTQMNSLIDNIPDVNNVFDRAYVDYAKLDEFCRPQL